MGVRGVTLKGEATRKRILDRAADMASVQGLEQVTVGRLAASLGMSKSGAYAHFGSKEELQLATIDAARERYFETVIAPGLEVPNGLARIEKTMHRLLAYLENRTFPGGCFFNSVNAEYHARPGPIRDSVREGKRNWRKRIADMTRNAQGSGEIRTDIDPELFAFQLESFVDAANWTLDDPDSQALVRRAVRGCIDNAIN
jgi:AcrR family transcriptional regulator